MNRIFSNSSDPSLAKKKNPRSEKSEVHSSSNSAATTKSSHSAELNQLSSNSEIYFSQKITAVESNNNSLCQPPANEDTDSDG